MRDASVGTAGGMVTTVITCERLARIRQNCDLLAVGWSPPHHEWLDDYRWAAHEIERLRGEVHARDVCIERLQVYIEDAMSRLTAIRMSMSTNATSAHSPQREEPQ